MADTTNAAPAPVAAPAPSAQPIPAAQPQSQGATVTPIKPHHSHAQPRDEGKFAGPPQAAPPTAPPTPRLLKVGDREVPEDELLADYQGRVVDHEAYQRSIQELERLRAEAAKWKDPRQVLTPEQRAEIAKAELEEWIAREEEAKLPPAEQQRRQQIRAIAAENARLKKELETRQQTEQQAQEEADRQHAIHMVRATMQLLGAEEKPGVVMREVAAELRAAALQGKEYPPATIAHRVRQRLRQESMGMVARLPPAELLSNEAVVKALNAIEDPALLERLAPLIERGRQLNLQRLGATGGTQPAPTATGPAPLKPGQQPRTDAEWAQAFRAGHQPQNPGEYNILLRLRDRGAV